MTTEKKKKKAQQQVLQQEQKERETGIGSSEYLTDHKFDRTIKTLQANILQHNQSKKLEIIAAARLLERQGYPLTKICDRITKALQGPKYETSGSYVRKVLPAEYKDPEQMATAFQQKHAGDTRYRQQEQLKNKDIREFTEQDIKVANPTQLRKVAKHQMQKADWWEQQAKQNKEQQEGQAAVTPIKQEEKKEQEAFETEVTIHPPWFDDPREGRCILRLRITPAEHKVEPISLIPIGPRKYNSKSKGKGKGKGIGPIGKGKEKTAALQKLMAYRDSQSRGEPE